MAREHWIIHCILYRVARKSLYTCICSLISLLTRTVTGPKSPYVHLHDSCTAGNVSTSSYSFALAAAAWQAGTIQSHLPAENRCPRTASFWRVIWWYPTGQLSGVVRSGHRGVQSQGTGEFRDLRPIHRPKLKSLLSAIVAHGKARQ